MNVLEPIFRILNHFVSLPPSSTSQQLWSGLHMNCPKFLLLILNLHLIRITCDLIHSRFHIEGISLMMSLADTTGTNKQEKHSQNHQLTWPPTSLYNCLFHIYNISVCLIGFSFFMIDLSPGLHWLLSEQWPSPDPQGWHEQYFSSPSEDV